MRGLITGFFDLPATPVDDGAPLRLGIDLHWRGGLLLWRGCPGTAHFDLWGLQGLESKGEEFLLHSFQLFFEGNLRAP